MNRRSVFKYLAGLFVAPAAIAAAKPAKVANSIMDMPRDLHTAVFGTRKSLQNLPPFKDS